MAAVETIAAKQKALDAPLPEDELSPEEDKRIRWRIDLCLLPVMMISYMFQFLDKASLSFTAIMGLREDLHLVGTDYNWAGSIYYFGYLISSYPVGALMIRLPLGKTISASALIWGIILILTTVVHNTTGLLINRFFLGVAESAIAPGLAAVVSIWYKRSEQPLRHGIWFLGNMLAGMFANLLAYAIGHIDTVTPWKALFAIFGGVTILWACAMFYLLPDIPGNAWFLNPEDRVKAVTRVKENKTGLKSQEIKFDQVIEALCDPIMWFLVAILLCNTIPNGGVANFGPIIIKGIGFDTFFTLLLGTITYAYQFILVIVTSTGSTLLPNTRTLWLAFTFAVSLAGVLMVQHIDPSRRWVRFVAYCMSLSFTSTLPLILSIVSGNIGGFTKKMTINAMVFIAYCVGNIIGPQLFFEREAPNYRSGFLAITVCYSVGLVLPLLLRAYLIWQNRRQDHKQQQQHEQGQETVLDEGDVNDLDRTDRQIPGFRYVY